MRLTKQIIALCVATIAVVGAYGQQPVKHGVGKSPGKVQAASVVLTEPGYEPASIKLRRGVPARVTFTRKVAATCATEVRLPEYGITRELPLNETVVVEFTPKKSGRFTFSCGMGMLKGTLVVR